MKILRLSLILMIWQALRGVSRISPPNAHYARSPLQLARGRRCLILHQNLHRFMQTQAAQVKEESPPRRSSSHGPSPFPAHLRPHMNKLNKSRDSSKPLITSDQSLRANQKLLVPFFKTHSELRIVPDITNPRDFRNGLLQLKNDVPGLVFKSEEAGGKFFRTTLTFQTANRKTTIEILAIGKQRVWTCEYYATLY